MIRIETIKDKMEWGLYATAKQVSIEAVTTYSSLDEKAQKILFSSIFMAAKMSKYESDEVSRVSFLSSNILDENEELDLVMSYRIKVPFALFPIDMTARTKVKTRTFSGVERRDKEEEEDGYVYVTPTGRAYHKSADCTYLKLSVWSVLFSDVEKLRNSSGGKYKLCTTCFKGTKPSKLQHVYICNYGIRYHKIATCRKIKRTVNKVKLSEVGTRTPCSKCAAKGE